MMISLILAFVGQTLSTGSFSTNSLDSKTDDKSYLYGSSKIVYVLSDPKPNSPTDFLISNIIQLEKLLNTGKQMKENEIQAKDPEIKRVVSSVLDLKELGRGALATHWDALGKTASGKKQRAKYESLFRALVEENYLQKIRHYIGGGHHIYFTGESEVGGQTKILARIRKTDVDVIVEFDASKPNGKWIISDTRLDETSLEETYRSSFNRIIRKNGGLTKGFPELLKAMEKRLAELKKGKATQL